MGQAEALSHRWQNFEKAALNWAALVIPRKSGQMWISRLYFMKFLHFL